MRENIKLFITKFLNSLRRLLTYEGPLTKPDLIERNNGVVIGVSEWKGKSVVSEYVKGKTYKGKACEGAQEAEVKLDNGKIVYAFIPPKCVILEGDCITIALLGNKDSTLRYYMYSKHLTSTATRTKCSKARIFPVL